MSMKFSETLRSLWIAAWAGFLLLTCGGCDSLRDWKRHPGVHEEFTDSKCVFAGRVLSSRQIMDKDGFIQGTFYVVRVEQLFKGIPLEEVEIYDENSSGRFPMKVGCRYLLFAYEGTFEGVEGLRLAINNYGNSGTMRQARKVLTMLRELKKSQSGTAPNGSPGKPFGDSEAQEGRHR